MAAYLISDVTVQNAEAFQNYRARAAAAIAAFGGRYLARGGAIVEIEGSWTPTNIIIAEFPDIERARAEGASDLEIHDTVLIAAVFCMCNRYVDGLATWAPDDPEFYRQRAAMVATNGYMASTLTAVAAK